MAWLALLPLLLCGAAPQADEASELARKCGAEIEWIRDPFQPPDGVMPHDPKFRPPRGGDRLAFLEQAKKTAAESKRLILCYLHRLDGSHMYRAPILDHYMNAVIWSDAEVVDLVRRKFVPLRLYADKAIGEALGIKAPDLVEPAIVILDADGKRVKSIDRIRTFNADWVRAALATAAADEPREPATPYEKAVALRRARKGDEALDALRDEKTGEAAAERGLILLRQGKLEKARGQLEEASRSGRAAEAEYWLAFIDYQSAAEGSAVRRWRDLVREHPDSRWGWKAAMNLAFWQDTTPQGPVPHAYEDVFWAPEEAYGRASTCLPRTTKDVDDIAARAVGFLLRQQRATGVWNDTRYAYWGEGILPNVRTAVTALVCAALLEWRAVDPARIDAAVARGEACLIDEERMAPGRNEECYANAYRLLYFARKHALARDEAARGDAAARMAGVVRRLERTITAKGFWAHEYPNPFATAAVIACLYEAKREGAPVPDALLRKAAAALLTQRSAAGGYTYGTDRPPSGLKDSAARAPICEYALFLGDRQPIESVRTALDGWWKHYPRIEKVRLCDYHTDGELAGFFFFHGFFHSTQAALALEEAPRKEQQARFLEQLVLLPEMDGSFIDDHELGKSYGTAMALLSLRNCLK